MDRHHGRGTRRPRGDARDYRSRHDRDRSRSPLRDRRKDREESRDYRSRNDRERRDRSPPRGPPRLSGRRDERDRDYNRDQDRYQSHPSQPPNRSNNQQLAREPPNGRANDTSREQSEAKRKPAADGEMAEASGAEEDSDAEMRRLMGFTTFRSTKNTEIPGNNKIYGVSKQKKTEYRQYMNRVGGFNRPLSPGK